MRLTVGKDKQFQRIGDALRYAESRGTAAADGKAPEIVIHLDPGVYHEKLRISIPGLVLEGEDAASTVVTYDDFANDMMPDGTRRGTFRSYTLLADAPGIRLLGLTIENAAGFREGAGQAIALYAEGEGIEVRNCRLISGQDTLFTGPLPPKEIQQGGFAGPKEFAPRVNGRQYYFDCYICGHVDFIFGSATAYFENCVIESVPRHTGYVTASSAPEGQKYGYVFSKCRFISEGPEKSVYLGRPWRNYARVVILNSYLGAHIRPEGWHDWQKEEAHTTAFYAEYGNYGPGAEGQREDWTHRLTEAEAAEYTLEKIRAQQA